MAYQGVSADKMELKGVFMGHTNWVTQIATNPRYPDFILSASRDKTLIAWNIARDEANTYVGTPQRSLLGHSHFVSDVVISSDGQFALSSSWDKDLRLWDLKTGQTTKRFAGHTKDVLSVAFSADNRQIVSSGRDNSIKLWNTLAECKYTILEDNHSDWISCVRFSPTNPKIVSCGWDRKVKVWSLTVCKLTANHLGHTGYLNTVTVSPDGSLCASGGKDGRCMLWDLNEGKHLYTLNADAEINALTFSPSRYWLCAATRNSIKIWDLENKQLIDEHVVHSHHRRRVVNDPSAEFGGQSSVVKKVGKEKGPTIPACTCLTWSSDGMRLYAGYTDNCIRMFCLSASQKDDTFA